MESLSFSRRRFLQFSAGAALVGGQLLTARNVLAQNLLTAPIQQLLLLNNEWNTIVNDAAQRAAKVLGLPYSSTNFNLNDATALTQAQSAIAAGKKLILTNSVDGSANKSIARAVAQNGGFLVNFGSNLPWSHPLDAGDGYVQAFVTREDVGFYQAVKFTLGEAVKKSGPALKVLHVTGPKGAFVDNLRSASVYHALSEFPQVKILGSLPGNWSAEDGQKAAEDLISRYGAPDVIIAQNDGSLTGVLAALRGLNIKPGKDVLTVGTDGATDILRAVKSGRVAATVFQSPAYHGIQAVVRLFDALNGYKPSVPERFVGFAGLLVTKDNVDGVLARFVDNPNLPFDPRLLSHVISGDKWDPQTPLVPINIKEYYAASGTPKPAGWQPPAAYAEAVASGEFEKVTQRYQQAYRLKLNNFDYKGISV
ncbi:sugar ABC transporter substrate-binding protein [Pantoea rodasii]|uniref:Sugar ABC transporter substrate-binding protein n=1 Tax=Pantoea rodasii TaxID=1076549 RepID=A0A2M9W5Z0_9GAMM|nr:sugar ABC transporter substrate-binding protein [Pantoea rodasii]ORM65342.1 ABC transporter substrate-binding protein [Pantoea rodasii]PJZ02945.1 sugar ABC transporter substrate-binding protein [Pantoea rodasii]